MTDVAGVGQSWQSSGINITNPAHYTRWTLVHKTAALSILKRPFLKILKHTFYHKEWVWVLINYTETTQPKCKNYNTEV